MELTFIAEIGWNFMGDLKLAHTMIKEAKSAGATHAKFQYWNPSKLKSGPWMSDGRLEIYKAAKLTKDAILHLQLLCKQEEIEFLISAFNAEDAQFLYDLGIRQIKIPSHEINNSALHFFASQNFEKCFVSLGAGRWKELEDAIAHYGKENWVGMHCVSSYPCKISDANLPKLKKLAPLVPELGLSDHSPGHIVPSLSVALGVTVIEKHFTSDKSLPGRDNKFALSKDEFQNMVKCVIEASHAMRDHGMDSLEVESDTISMYRGRWG